MGRREIRVADRIIGYIIEKDGTGLSTRSFTVHCSKNGTRIVPTKGDGGDGDEND